MCQRTRRPNPRVELFAIAQLQAEEARREEAAKRKAGVSAMPSPDFGNVGKVGLDGWEEDPSSGSTQVDASNMDGGTLPFQNADMPDNGFPDMTSLDHLHEPALLHNLRRRFFSQACPYTYTADIVIAMNPYRWFPQLYTDEMRKEYLVYDRAKLDPHVYTTSSLAYSGLQESKSNQTILVSGESGAGKTETVKILMAHLAFMASSDDASHIRRIVESNPLLESFGNAQTVRNDNSSRFGKFIELQLNSECRLEGSKCRTYLLEKSRVVSQDSGERNFHIFYQMLAADSETRTAIGLGDASLCRDSLRYTSMGASKTDTIEGKTDAQRFQGTVSALALLAIDGPKLTRLLRALAAVLLLGQLEFAGSEEASALTEASKQAAATAAEVLAVDATELERSLTHRTIRMRNESVVKQLPPSSATGNRDALAKEVYARVFDWLVEQICIATCAPSDQAKTFVGLLDIFGFESFAINRFEQLCINYANEKLQQKFTHDVFKAVQQEYTAEGIPWDRIEFKDNAPILALIESKLGIIAMLNEECVRPKGSNQNFVSKLVSVHKEDPAFSAPKLGKMRELQFSIRHYAGEVMYTSEGWLDRNNDAVSEDLVFLMRSSGNELLASLFQEDSKGKRDTVVTKFKSSLSQLMDTIGQTGTQYVRCIKPNQTKSAAEVNNDMVVDQLRCAGVIEAIRISRAGFPARMPLKDFSQRFHLLVQSYSSKRLAQFSLRTPVVLGTDEVANCRKLLASLLGADEQYQVGRTRVYFKTGVLESLEERRALLIQAAAVELGRMVRGHQTKRLFRRMQHIARRVQAIWRMNLARNVYRRIRRVILLCQARRRAVLAARRLHQLRRQRAATKIQAQWRRRRAMKELESARGAAIRIQALARCWLCRRHFQVSLAEFKEQAKLENQVKALKAKLEAQERAAAANANSAAANSGDANSGEAQAPAEILEALQALGAENAKLHMELDRLREENDKLRRENQKLRAADTARGAKLASYSRSKKYADDDHRGRGDNSSECGREERQDQDNSPRNAPETPAEAVTAVRSMQIYPPLNEFWEDVPCMGIPHLETGSLVHIKLGQNILFVDIHGKSLMWQAWMHNHAGYRNCMGFIVERCSEQDQKQKAKRSSIWGSSPKDASHRACHDGQSIGDAFVLRSSWTRKYVKMGGLLDWYCLQVSGKSADDAAVFTYKPLYCGESSQAESYSFALKLHGKDKYLCLQSDGAVAMEKVGDVDSASNKPNLIAGLECLLPATSYDIVIYDQQIGLTVSKDLPLRVVGFKNVQNSGPPEAGPAEASGRVRLGDVITNVNGQDVTRSQREDVLHLINADRPVTLRFLSIDPT
ncbi:unnamed protein product [Effrenium voratum]|uniref:Uncharacterized protein n=1 Tax=Effrenium voratum TaxID=2562239 RepID=A0AA36IXQ0_9DINO|nr:unnamed protein product [Effrenium voratum]